MSADRLHMPTLLPHLIHQGLTRYDDRPCLCMGNVKITYAEVRAQTSRFMQALASKGIGKGSRTAVISGNRPEVLYNMSAQSLAGVCSTALHPLGSLDDHAYVLEDAGIDT